MVCLACRRVGSGICDACRATLRLAPVGATPDGILIRSWALHEGAARVLVRRLKYQAVPAIAGLIARELAEAVPADAGCLVPVTRTFARRIRYGIDPARELAMALSRHTGVPVVHALSPPLWSPANAGVERSRRHAPGFRTRFLPASAVLVDDVTTTGLTLDAAGRALGGVRTALTATRAP